MQNSLPAITEQAQTILCHFSPDKQAKYAVQRERCFTGKAPTIFELSKIHGEHVAESWVQIQLRDLNEFTGVTNKMSAEQLETLANSILYYYRGLKLTEVMLFLQMFKMGEFGKFYGVVDPLVISTALREFWDYRSDFLMRSEAVNLATKKEKELKEILSDNSRMDKTEWDEISWLFNM